MLRNLMIVAAGVAAAVPAPIALAQGDPFDAYRARLTALARDARVSEATIAAVIPELTYNPRVVELDGGQPGGTSGTSAIPPFAPYRASHVDAARIARGRERYTALRPLLTRIEAETGVPESIMVSIWGNETNYGAYRGDFDLARSLASLAFDGRRRALFEGEFVATLKLIDRGIPRSVLVGSWAGATGHPQFLPSMVIKVARDGDGDGRADIWRSEADALASIANYFVAAGWRRGEPWGVEARVPADFVADAQATRLASPRCPRVHQRHTRWRTVGEWRALGIAPQGSIGNDVLTTLIEPDGRGQPAYLLTGNYRVILDYNCSNFYGLAVGLLADAVAR